MAVKAFFKGNIYRHSNPHASLEIVVLAVHHQNSERVKLKIQYRHKNGEIQYTGKGMDQNSDQIRILTDHFQNWTCVGNVRDPFNILPYVEAKDDRDWDALLGDIGEPYSVEEPS